MSASTTLPAPPLSGEQLLMHGPARYLLTTPSGAGYNPINGGLRARGRRRLLLYSALAVLAMCSLCAVAALVANGLGAESARKNDERTP